jgi:gamma-glutamylcyclotransferase (GGCT)/AIG2-like uncharacterized protein YtfP
VYLFVYGSLRRNHSTATHPLLAGAPHHGDARVQGTLYRVDWYPGLVLAGDGWVHGELFELPDARADAMIAALDAYEGDGYGRTSANVHLADGRVVASWLYVYLGPTRGLDTIASGDFGTPTHRTHPDAPPPPSDER